MKIKLEILRTTLTSLRHGITVGNNETTDQSDCFVFENGNVFSYNDDVAISTKLKTELNGAVSAKELLDLVNKLNGETVDVTTEDNEIRLKCGRSKAGIKFQAEILMPMDEVKPPPLTSKKWKKVKPDFKDGLKKCLFSTSVDHNEQLITSIHCTEDRLESTDNDRATICYITTSFQSNMFIPEDSCKKLVSFKTVHAYDNSQAGWNHFLVDDDVIFSIRAPENSETFPDLNKAFDFEGHEFNFPKNTNDILDKAGVFVDAEFEQDKFIIISMTKKGVMKIRAEGDTGWFEETARTKGYSGEEISFSINPRYLQQILKNVNTAFIGKDRVMFKTDGFEHVVALEN